MYLGEIYHHHQYGYAKMRPVASTWSKPLKVGGTPIMVHGIGPIFNEGDGLFDPLSDPGIILHGKLEA